MTNYIRFEDNSQENIQNSWEKMVEEVQCSYLLPPDRKKICVDIGTNIGSFVYRAFDEGCFEQIYGFEPAFQTYHTALTILKEKNVISPNIRISNLAVANETGTIFRLHGNSTGCSGDASLLPPKDPTGIQTESCLSISLDDIFDYLQIDHIDYLKMDCEGAEAEILHACTRLSDISVIMAEIHGAPENAALCCNFLQGKGFFAFQLRSRDIESGMPMIVAFNTNTNVGDIGGYYNIVDAQRYTIGSLNPNIRELYDKARKEYEHTQKVTI